MYKVLTLLALCAVAFVLAADDSKVVVLDTTNFDSFIKSTPLALIEFYAPWCGHCKSLAPEYDKASLELEGKNAGVLAKVDCTTQREICDKFEVRGFPTLKVFRNDGSEPGEYDAARKADAIVRFMVKQNSPAVTTLNSEEEVKNFAAKDPVKIVAFLRDSDSQDAFKKVASSLRNEFSFGAVVGKSSVDSAFKVTAPAVVIFRDFDEGPVTFTGTVNSDTFEDDLGTFITAQSFPLVGEIGPENYSKYVERGLNFVWFFFDPENTDQKKLIENVITPVARDNRAQLSFVKLDGIRWAEHGKSMGLNGETPGLVIEDREHRKNFVYPQSDALTLDGLKKHVSSFLSGTASPTVRSEPVPDSNDGPVKVIVGKTFDSIVMDDSKDVFVEFYAPWCGHCKSLTPKFEELGKIFESDNGVVIAKIDATANDSPADIQGFPTLILYPAGDKSNHVDYSGDRSVKDMAKFIRTHGKVVKKSAADHDHSHDHDDDHDHSHDHDEHDDL